VIVDAEERARRGGRRLVLIRDSAQIKLLDAGAHARSLDLIDLRSIQAHRR